MLPLTYLILGFENYRGVHFGVKFESQNVVQEKCNKNVIPFAALFNENYQMFYV
jgi:hypothetical protein